MKSLTMLCMIFFAVFLSYGAPLADTGEPSTEKNSYSEKDQLFQPLIADPRWPHFSMSYQLATGDRELKNIGATSFGETLPFYTGQTSCGGEWQTGIQAAVFAVFDLDSESHDLINADYFVGIPVSYRKDKLSAMFRIFHQSSHLGDEYLLRSRTDRVNLSYEALDFKISHNTLPWLRLYAGSGYILRKEPKDLKRWSVQYGLEIRSPDLFLNGRVYPVFGADMKNREESGWNGDLSLRAGVGLVTEKTLWNRLQIMLEYFNGYSPHGQFYERTIEYIGLGTHFYF